MTGQNTAEPLRRQRSRTPEGFPRKWEYGPGATKWTAPGNPFSKIGQDSSSHHSNAHSRFPQQQRGSWEHSNSRGPGNQRHDKPYHDHRDKGRGRGRGGGGNRGHRGGSNQYRDRGGKSDYGAKRNEKRRTSPLPPRAESSRFWDGDSPETTSWKNDNPVRDGSPGPGDRKMDANSIPSSIAGPSRVDLGSHQGYSVVGTTDDPPDSFNQPTRGTPPPWPASQWKQTPTLSNPPGKSGDVEMLDVEEKPKVVDASTTETRSEIEDEPTVEGAGRVSEQVNPELEANSKVRAEVGERTKAELEEMIRTELGERMKVELEERVRAVEDRAKAELEGRTRAHAAERALWEQEKVSADKQIRSLQDVLGQRDSALEKSQKSADEVGMRSMEWEDHFHRAKREVERQKGLVEERDSELQRYTEVVADMQRDLDQTKQLLDSRTEENKVAQAFMTTADLYSVADVKRMVDQLNDEIFQCAMDMSDSLTKYRENSPSYTSEEDKAWKPRFEQACSSITGMWAEHSVSCIQAGVEKNDPILFECLTQTLFIYRCRDVIQRLWLADEGVDQHLKGLWGHILDSREMSIAKNWLAITNSALKQLSFEDSEVLRRLIDMLIVAGWRPDPKTQELQDSIRAKLTEITAKAIKIREVISEGILSAHIEVFCFDMGDTFDSKHMQDAYDVSGRDFATKCQDGEVLVCTTGLGLRCIVASRSSSPNATGERRRREVVMKAKVVTQSAIVDS